ncbi:hypothetical protein S83_060589, partial [Arachis hypogaea]
LLSQSARKFCSGPSAPTRVSSIVEKEFLYREKFAVLELKINQGIFFCCVQVLDSTLILEL